MNVDLIHIRIEHSILIVLRIWIAVGLVCVRCIQSRVVCWRIREHSMNSIIKIGSFRRRWKRVVPLREIKFFLHVLLPFQLRIANGGIGFVSDRRIHFGAECW